MTNSRQKLGFTLVELMVVIMIIGILTAIAIPAINRAVIAGRQTAIRMEINALEQAVENYMLKYGDYPPDGSDWDVMVRHLRKLFPRIQSSPDIQLLKQLTYSGSGPLVLDPSHPEFWKHPSFDTAAMDRAEALVFFLGGFSSDELRPLTGTGGPLSLRPGQADDGDVSHYEVNSERGNSFFDFDPKRLTYRRETDASPLESFDELDDGRSRDLLPVYLSSNREGAPIVYFDSRTYGLLQAASGSNPAVYNGYSSSKYGGVRPMKSDRDIKPGPYASEAIAFNAVGFHKPNSFQLISPGLDGHFGSLVSPPGQLSPPIHFATESGKAYVPVPGGIWYGGVSRYQDDSLDLLPMLDNITNFTTSTLEDELE